MYSAIVFELVCVCVCVCVYNYFSDILCALLFIYYSTVVQTDLCPNMASTAI